MKAPSFADIIIRRRNAEANIREARGRLLVAEAELKAVQEMCEHLHVRKKSLYSGEADLRCADCNKDIS